MSRTVSSGQNEGTCAHANARVCMRVPPSPPPPMRTPQTLGAPLFWTPHSWRGDGRSHPILAHVASFDGGPESFRAAVAPLPAAPGPPPPPPIPTKADTAEGEALAAATVATASRGCRSSETERRECEVRRWLASRSQAVPNEAGTVSLRGGRVQGMS